MKGLSKEELETRYDLVLALPERIQAIPDGTSGETKHTGGWSASASKRNIKFDSGDYHGSMTIVLVLSLPVLFSI